MSVLLALGGMLRALALLAVAWVTVRAGRATFRLRYPDARRWPCPLCEGTGHVTEARLSNAQARVRDGGRL